MAAFNWTNMQFVLTATESSAVLQFGARNDPEAFGLDDVSVTPVSPPRLQGVTLAKGGITLAWTTLPGLLYQVQYTTNLTGGWDNLGGALAATNQTTMLTDVQPSDQRRFYRVFLAQ
jgi:hypothetical protein